MIKKVYTICPAFNKYSIFICLLLLLAIYKNLQNWKRGRGVFHENKYPFLNLIIPEV